MTFFVPPDPDQPRQAGAGSARLIKRTVAFGVNRPSRYLHCERYRLPNKSVTKSEEFSIAFTACGSPAARKSSLPGVSS